jgi:hypothetical protein
MESKKRKVGKEVGNKTKAALVAEETTKHYYSEVEEAIKDLMEILEEEVRYVGVHTEEKDVDKKVGKFICDLGCTKNRDKILEDYGVLLAH